MINSLFFDKKHLTYKIPINKENPFFKIIAVTVPSVKNIDKEIINKVSNVSLEYVYRMENNIEVKNFVFDDLIHKVGPNQTDGLFKIGEILFEYSEHNLYKEIEFVCKIDRDDDFKMILFYDTLHLYIPLQEAFGRFKNHLERNDNVKILFSAPFGQGKTTFLNYFFEEFKNQYEVFKIYPVNYSVSHNEDIFKYIKCELLFQLLGKDVEFDKTKFSYLETAPQFFKKNVQHFLAPFLMLLPKVGKSASDIYERYYKLAVEYFEYHDKQNIDDKEKAIKFIKELYDEEGTIYEDNFYTQLIRQLMEQNKEKTKKETVLLIDDLDRMDPDHIFRILNVFAAHFDSQEYNGGFANKFGFDKIIIVCDHSNLREIFSHRYGSKTSFDGYINKYFSNEPFSYKIKNPEVFINQIKSSQLGQDQMHVFLHIISDMINTESLTVREFNKLQKQNMLLINGVDGTSTKRGSVNVTAREVIGRYKNTHFLFFPFLYYLSKLSDINSIIEKLKKTSELLNYDYNRRRSLNFEALTSNGFIPLVFEENYEENKEYSYTFRGSNYTFKIFKDHGYNQYRINELKMTNGGAKQQFTEKDFYEVLILNAQRFKEIGIGE